MELGEVEAPVAEPVPEDELLELGLDVPLAELPVDEDPDFLLVSMR